MPKFKDMTPEKAKEFLMDFLDDMIGIDRDNMSKAERKLFDKITIQPQGPKRLFKACACDNDLGIHIYDKDTCDFKKPWDGWTQEDVGCSSSYFRVDEEYLVMGGPELVCDHEDAGDGICFHCGAEL